MVLLSRVAGGIEDKGVAGLNFGTAIEAHTTWRRRTPGSTSLLAAS